MLVCGYAGCALHLWDKFPLKFWGLSSGYDLKLAGGFGSLTDVQV